VRVLDCTFGLGRDALVMAASGAHVDGLEAQPLLAAFATAGLAHLRGAGADAATRVRVQRAEYATFLESAGQGAYDVVYFDPQVKRIRLQFRNPNPTRRMNQVTEARMRASSVSGMRPRKRTVPASTVIATRCK